MSEIHDAWDRECRKRVILEKALADILRYATTCASDNRGVAKDFENIAADAREALKRAEETR